MSEETKIEEAKIEKAKISGRNAMHHDLRLLEKVQGISAVTLLDVGKERIQVPQKYLCLQCVDGEGRKFRVVCAVTEVKWISPHPAIMMDEVIGGQGFFTQKEIRHRMDNQALNLEPLSAKVTKMCVPTSIQYKTGDATIALAAGPQIIAHVCNDKGRWGRGFSGELAQRYPEAEVAYRDMGSYVLGEVQFVEAPNGRVIVANMVAQHGLKSLLNKVPLQYDMLEKCLMAVAQKALELEAKVQMPRIGCGLAGGDWGTVETLISRCLSNRGVPVFVFASRWGG